MALSGTISKSITGRTYKIVWSATQSVSGNYSTITCKHYLVNDSSYSLYINSRSNTCTVDGTEKSFTSSSISTSGGSTITLGSTSHTVYHNADGSKSCTIKGVFNIQATLSGTYYSSITASGTVTLDTIPRGATLTSGVAFNDEDVSPSIKYSNPAGSVATSLQACIASTDGKTVYVPYRDISKSGTSYTFTLTDDEKETLRNLIPNSQKVDLKYYVKTVISGSTFYSSGATYMQIKPGYPTMNVVWGINDSKSIYLTNSTSAIIKGVTDIDWTITNKTAYKGASVASVKVENGSSTSDKDSGVFADVTTANCTATIYDSRGFSSKYTVEGEAIDYFMPTIKGDIGNPTTAGEMLYRVSGNVFNGTFGKAEGAKTNDFKCYYRYYENDDGFGEDDEGWIEIPEEDITVEGNTYSIVSKITGLNYRNKYSFQARIEDQIYNVMTLNVKTVSSIPVYDWSDTDFNHNTIVTFQEDFILYSPNGTAYKISVSDSGALTVTAA